MKEMAPYYTPEWRFTPDDPDPGTALFLLFARMLDGNIKRLNRVPQKNFIAFLNMLDISLQAPKPAKAYLTFFLSEGAQQHVLVPAGTKVAGLPVEPTAEPVLFETTGPMVVTPAKLKELYHVSTVHDRIVRIGTEWNGQHAAVLFDHEAGPNLQEHALYIRMDDLFQVTHGTVLELELTHSQKRFTEAAACRLLAEDGVEWLYYSLGSWHAFDEVTADGNRIELRKHSVRPWDEVELEGIQGRWLQCRAASIRVLAGTLPLAELELDGLKLKGRYLDVTEEEHGIEPERMYFNDIQVSNDGFHPFGEMFAPFGIFYASSSEVFSKRGAYVTASFNISYTEHRLFPQKPPEINWKMVMKREEVDKLDIPDEVTIARVLWEYWNGSAWVRLPAGKEAETLFLPAHREAAEAQIAFLCPADLEQTFVNSEWGYWIRARVLQINNMYSANAVYVSPWLENVRFTYDDLEHERLPERCISRNNAEVFDVSRNLEGGGNVFRPFRKLEGHRPALYMAFDRAMERGPISLYFSLQQQKVSAQEAPHIEWEYLQAGRQTPEWRPLKVRDETSGLLQSGVIQFYAPVDMGEARLFGAQGFWLRALNRDGAFDLSDDTLPRPKALGIWPNTVPALQQESLEGEVPQKVRPEHLYEEGTLEAALSRQPVLSEEVWVDETEQLREEDVARLEQTGIPVQQLRDSNGQLMKCWVKYERVDQLLSSGPSDRYYVIDRTSGKLRFGDGVQGKPLTNQDTERVKVSYKTGGGTRGNLDRMTIQGLQSSIAFIQGVTNYEPASGGCDAETVEQAAKRGPQRIKHRNRAVTAEDFEWLAREAYPNISRVKCLPNYNARLEKEAGCMLLVVLAKGGGDSALAFSEVKKQIEAHLLSRAAYTVAFPGSIQVIEPAYLEIGVQAVLAVSSMEQALQAETEAIERVRRFLDPFEGGFDGRGWDIGKTLHPSMFYALFKSIGSIHHVARLSLTVTKVEDGERTEIVPEKMGEWLHGVIKSGQHQITVQIL